MYITERNKFILKNSHSTYMYLFNINNSELLNSNIIIFVAYLNPSFYNIHTQIKIISQVKKCHIYLRVYPIS